MSERAQEYFRKADDKIEFAPALPGVDLPWYVDAAELLSEPDPGPTPWLVEDVMVDRALVAVVGRWKTTKSFGMLDVCLSVATGRPAFGTFAVPEPGPVVFVNEESGRAALWRRLDALCRGRAIDPESLRGRLLVAPNARVRLDDEGWQARLLALGRQLTPRLIVFDPLARMKDPGRVENEQSGMAPLIEFLRQLRDESGAAVAFVHHTGHQGEHMRGSSDLESAWETRLRWKRDGQASVVTVESEHREAEAAPSFDYRIAWDGLSRSMRFEAIEDEQLGRVREYMDAHPDASANEVHKAVGGARSKVLELVKTARERGTEAPEPPSTTSAEPKAGRGTPSAAFRRLGTTTTTAVEVLVPDVQYHPSLNDRPLIGDAGYLERLFAAFGEGHATEAEWHLGERTHRFLSLIATCDPRSQISLPDERFRKKRRSHA
jgi:AAA domain